MLTIEQAAKLTPNTEAFELAVDAASDVCAAEPKNKEAAKLLIFLLQRNEDYVMKQAHGR